MPKLRAVTAAVLLILAASLSAATFTVTSSAPEGPGTLNQALLDANATPGLDQIRFAVPVASIPATGLPQSTDPVDIDGLLTSGDRVSIVMPDTFDVTAGFKFAAGSSGSSLRNVNMDPVPNLAVRVFAGVLGVTIEKNIFRTPVVIDGDESVILDNLFSGPGAELRINGDLNEVLRNRLPSVVLGVLSDANVIGRERTAGNTIARLTTLGTRNRIRSNTFPGGGGAAITASSVTETVTSIAFNTISGYATGILVSAGTGVAIQRNSIANTGIPIDLGGDGPTPNDPAPDADTGPNNRQNHPVLTAATLSGGSLIVTGSLFSVPNTPFEVELFSNSASDPDARTLLAVVPVGTESGGIATFTHTITSPLPAPDEVITATAINRTTADTSEVSPPVPIDEPGTVAFSTATYRVSEREGTVTLTIHRTGGSDSTFVVYSTERGTATPPADFASSSGTITFGPGVTTQTITIPIVADSIAEPEETFTVTLRAPVGGPALGTPSTATVVIAAHLDIPTASTWALILLALALAAITLVRIGG